MSVAERDIDDLPRNPANYTALTPLWFLERAALVHPNRNSLIHASVRFTWSQTYRRCRQLASALTRRAVTFGSTVAVIAPNIPALFEAHFGIPMSGAVLNAVNIRLNAEAIAFLLGHSQSDVIMVDQEFYSSAEEALKIIADKSEGKFKPPTLIVIADGNCDPKSLQYALGRGAIEYEKFLETGDPDFAWKPPEDEWHSIALGYTSGTTASPKGVVLHHRGAYLMALSNPIIWEIKEGAVYLWTLPMFHCNGWCFPWTLAALCVASICLRQVTAKGVYSAIANLGVTHFCAAPVVLNNIVNASKEDTILPLPRVVHVMTAGAAPPPFVLSAMSKRGFKVTHTYGLSETYGPSTVCAWKPEWDLLPPEDQARMNARQGVRYIGLEGLDVVNTQNMRPVPADGATVGEIVFRGNVVMKGYLKNPKANKETFANGWYHSGDLAVKHPDGYIEIKDRSKDIIISGGENISSVEVENVLYQHPAILEVSVVARPDERWGESPCAFVTLKSNVHPSNQQQLTEDIMKFGRSKMPAYWVPKSVVFGPLPKTATGKIQKHVLRAKAKEMGPVKKSAADAVANEYVPRAEAEGGGTNQNFPQAGVVGTDPGLVFNKALECFNDKYIYSSCDEAYRLTENGDLHVPPEYTDQYCNGPCLMETHHVLDCIDGILEHFVFYNRATLKDVRETIETGCSYGPKRGDFNVEEHIEADDGVANTKVPRLGFYASLLTIIVWHLLF